MTLGVVGIFMIHMLLTSGKDKVSGLTKPPEALMEKNKGGTTVQFNCYLAMKLKFASGLYEGLLLDPEVAANYQSAYNSPSHGKGSKKMWDRNILIPAPRERHLSPHSLRNRYLSLPLSHEKH